MQTDQKIDLCGLSCPLPILRAKKTLAKMLSGETLEVLATDVGAPKDFAAFCRQTGNDLVSTEELPDGKFCFVLRRK